MSDKAGLTLDVLDLRATYRDGDRVVPALNGVSFSVGPGEVLALVGPSGAGKSTILDIVAGLADPSSGIVLINGEPQSAPRRMATSVYMRQRDLLLPWRTAVANAALGLEAGGMPARDARRCAADRFAEFGLAGADDRYPAQLSGGMRQRVSFLRTILAGRPLLLLDEPFGALDALTRATMQDWLAAMLLRERRTTLLVTHDVEEALLLADRVVVLSAGPATVDLDEPVTLPKPRTHSLVTDPGFVAQKARLLAALRLVPAASR